MQCCFDPSEIFLSPRSVAAWWQVCDILSSKFIWQIMWVPYYELNYTLCWKQQNKSHHFWSTFGLPNSIPKTASFTEFVDLGLNIWISFLVSCTPLWEFMSRKPVGIWSSTCKQCCSTLVDLHNGASGWINHQPVWELEEEEDSSFSRFCISLNGAKVHRGRLVSSVMHCMASRVCAASQLISHVKVQSSPNCGFWW